MMGLVKMVYPTWGMGSSIGNTASNTKQLVKQLYSTGLLAETVLLEI